MIVNPQFVSSPLDARGSLLQLRQCVSASTFIARGSSRRQVRGLTRCMKKPESLDEEPGLMSRESLMNILTNAMNSTPWITACWCGRHCTSNVNQNLRLPKGHLVCALSITKYFPPTCCTKRSEIRQMLLLDEWG